MSFQDGAIVLVDAATGEPRRAPEPSARRCSSLAAGFGSVWVTKSDERTRTVLRINAKTRKRGARAARSRSRGRAATWRSPRGRARSGWPCATRPTATTARSRSCASTPAPASQQQIAVADGVQDLAVGEGAVWVTNRFSDTVTRIRVERRPAGPRGGRARARRASPSARARSGSPRRWTTRSRASTRAACRTRHIHDRRRSPSASRSAAARCGRRRRRPGASSASTRETRKVLERIDTGSRPFALDITRGRAVWLTLLDSGGVQRVRFYAAGAEPRARGATGRGARRRRPAARASPGRSASGSAAGAARRSSRTACAGAP